MESNSQKLALELATDLHKDHRRSDGKLYITHPIAVAEKVVDYFNKNTHLILSKSFKDKAIQAAYLHDVLEDCPIDSNYLADRGISRQVIYICHILNKKIYPSYAFYIKSVADNSIAAIVKYYDLEHNSEGLNKGAKLDKYELSQLYLKSKCPFLEHT